MQTCWTDTVGEKAELEARRVPLRLLEEAGVWSQGGARRNAVT